MCGRFTLKTPAPALIEHFGLADDALRQLSLFEPRYNVAPTQDVTVVRTASGGGREVGAMRWGLIPSWTKEFPSSRPLINARSETAAEKPSFRTALRRRRCLIPADGFYEWKAAGKSKQPFYIRRLDEEPFAFAGLWETWTGEGTRSRSAAAGDGRSSGGEASPGPRIESCTILTTGANELLSTLHDRMPVIVAAADYEQWLDRDVEDPQLLHHLLAPLANDDLALDPVSKRVNRVANDDPQCVEIQRELF